jgi:deoxyribodipyrimidine photo-lyase
MKNERTRQLNKADVTKGPVVYWMSRDQRARDNWALIHAQQLALKTQSPLMVLFCLVPDFLGATQRQYGFMLRGLAELQSELKRKNIPLFLIKGAPEKAVPAFVNKHKAGAMVTDFDPLKIKRAWKDKVSASAAAAFFETDAHNIVPCWQASPKQEFGAYTLRPKINRQLDTFLEPFPGVKKHPHTVKANDGPINPDKLLASLKINKRVTEVTWIKPGEKAAHRQMNRFIRNTLAPYAEQSNDPNQDAQSHLSPYLHFGQISAQRVAKAIIHADISPDAQNAFLEQLIIRKELSDNFCHYNQNYDRFEGFPDWALKTIRAHQKDKRNYLYTLKQFQDAATHDPLWNAAQQQMVRAGKMHGYMRMYWAKKIVEWTRSAQEAMQIAIELNDTFELDGRDPNGYTGIAWSVGGVHDRAWPERAVFGKIRYMNYNGCKSKFDVQRYIDQHLTP